MEIINILKSDPDKEINLRWSSLEGANLDGANLKGANLDGENLEETRLNGANLKKANLRLANLKGASLNAAFIRSWNSPSLSCSNSQDRSSVRVTSTTAEATRLVNMPRKSALSRYSRGTLCNALLAS